MVKVTYLSLKVPHSGHLVWLKALKTLGHDVRATSIYSLTGIRPNHGNILITEGVRPTIIGTLQKGLYRCWASVAHSPSILNHLINKLYTLPDLVLAVSNLVKDLVENRAIVLYPAPPELELLLKVETDHDVRKPWICFCGAFIPIKGVHLVPDIVHELKKEGMKVLFILIGGTEKEPQGQLIVNKARRLGIKDYIRIVGPLPRAELFKLLRNCSIYLQPSLFDAFPISVIEAMALGVVPVVTKYVGSRDLIEIVDGSLIREPDPKDIAEELISLLTNPKLLKEYSYLSRIVTRNVLSFKSTLDRVKDFVEMCLDAGVR